MITQDYFDKHFKLHNKLVLYTNDGIKLEVTKEPHFHLSGGHTRIDLMDLEDLAWFCNARGLSLKPTNNSNTVV